MSLSLIGISYQHSPLTAGGRESGGLCRWTEERSQDLEDVERAAGQKEEGGGIGFMPRGLVLEM